ncbi:MAG: type II secretion system F family protein [Desulfurococcales archaeon]|nr:type II secretion system F family protein [Desulfurococcales archaeon]
MAEERVSLLEGLRNRIKSDLMKKAFMADAVIDVDKMSSYVLVGYLMFLMGIILLVLGVFLVVYLWVSPFLAFALPLGLIGAGIIVIVQVHVKANMLVSARKYRAERELPFISTFMTLTATIGLPLAKALKEALKIDFFKQFKREIHFIEKIKLFYIMSDIDAIEYISKFHPSMQMREFYQTLVASERSGGDKYRVLFEKTRYYMKILEDRITRLIERFSLITNMEVMFFVVIPLALIIIGALFAGNQGLTLTYTASIGFPVISFILLYYVINAIYPEELKENPPMLVFNIFFTLEVFTFIVTMFFIPDSYFVGAAIEKYEFVGLLMAILAIGAGLYYNMWYREASDLFYSIPVVTRHIAEEGKKGKTPKQAIIGLTRFRLPKRMDTLLRVIAARLSLGLSIREAIQGLRMPWLASLYFQLLDTAERYGSDPKSLDLLASFTEDVAAVAKIVEDRSFSFKLGAMIAIASLVLGFTIVFEMVLTQFTSLANTLIQGAGAGGFVLPIQPVSEDMLPTLKAVSYMGIVLNTFFISMLAGKTVKGSLAAGFLLAGINILLALAAVRVIVHFI